MTRAAEEAKVTEMTAIQCYQYLRDVCSWRLTSVDSPLLLGGQGVVVQIDESLFRHKPKVNIEGSEQLLTFCDIFSQHHRGRPRSEQWVFGMVDTSTGDNGDGAMSGCSNSAPNNPTAC